MCHALLIDGENVPSRLAATILAAAPEDAQVRRVYGNVAHLNGWLSISGLRVVHTLQGKNAADMQIAIEAMELLLRDNYRGFTIATSDGDFIPLVLRLREAGACVKIMGSAQASEALRKSAHCFEALAMQQPDIATVPPRPKAPATRDPVDVISRWIGNGELPMSELSTRLQKERPHDMCQWLGTAGPRTFLEKHTERFSIDRTGSATMVRLVRKAATPPTP